MEEKADAEKRAAGATETDIKSLLFNFAWWMKKQGYAESTIKSYVKILERLIKLGADLYDPETVKTNHSNRGIVEQAAKLIEADFKYVCDIDGVKALP